MVNIIQQAISLTVLLFLVSALILRARRPVTPVWSIMAMASFVIILTDIVPIDELDSVINLDVILFLIGMFSLVSMAESSGVLEAAAFKLISMFRSSSSLVYASSFFFGLLSAIAVNDTVALMGPPIAYAIAKAAGVNPEPMFLLLAFSITIGSAMTPIGNPQNVLIAIESGMSSPFMQFIKYLSVPTLINLFITAFIIKKIYRIDSGKHYILVVPEEKITNKRDATLAVIGLAAVIALLILNDILELLGLSHVNKRGFIPFVIAAGIYMLSSNPRAILQKVDWGTIIFFITMFITMDGIWRSGILTPIMSTLLPHKLEGIHNIASIIIASLTLSQLLSNVPFAKLFIQYMNELGYTGEDVESWITLSMASTIAGNLTLLGAASNIIILEALESRIGQTISFTKFTKIGIIVTTINIIVYTLYILAVTMLLKL